MEKKYLIFAIIAFTLLFGAGSALAYGWGGGWFGSFKQINPDEIASRQQTMFERQAQILGISIEEIKNYWAEGKTLKEIMEEKGINQEDVQARMKELRLKEMKSYLQILVDKGIITQSQADKRLEIMENQLKNNRMGKIGKGCGMGIGFGRGFGW